MGYIAFRDQLIEYCLNASVIIHIVFEAFRKRRMPFLTGFEIYVFFGGNLFNPYHQFCRYPLSADDTAGFNIILISKDLCRCRDLTG